MSLLYEILKPIVKNIVKKKAHDPKLCANRHGTFFYKAVKVPSVKLCFNKPVMKLLRAFGKTERCCHIKRYRRKNRQRYSYRSKSETDKSQHNP